VDAEPIVEPDDDRFKQVNNKKKFWNKKKLITLAGYVGITDLPKTETVGRFKQKISEQLSPEKLEATLANVKGITAARNIYRLVFGKNPDTNMDIPTIKEEIRKNITGITAAPAAPLAVPKTKNEPNDVSGRPATKINNFMNQPEEKTQNEDEDYKKTFLELWEKVKDINRKDIDEKIRSLPPDKGDVKKMLKELQDLLDKSGKYVPPLKARGLFLARAADKDKNKTLSGKEIRAMIQSDIELKDLFTIGKTGELDVNLEPFVSWGTSRKIIDINKDGKYSFKEFAEYYLAAVLKNTVRDKLIKGDYAGETFERMVALFGIADKKPSKPVVTSSQIDNKKLPVVARSNTPPVVTPSPGKFQVGDRVKSTSKTGLTAGLIGTITKRTDKAASVTWDNQTETPSKPLKQLEPITIKPVTIKPVTIMDGFKETKEDIDKEKVPVVTPSKTAKKKSVQPLPGNFKVGDLVKNTSKTGLTAGLTGLITKRTPKTAAVFWEDGNDTTNKPLKELKMVTISKEAEEKIKTIFNSYDTKRTDNFLNNGEDFNFLQENLPKRSQVFLKKDLFEKPDGKSGFSFDEFRFMLTVSPEMIEKFEEREAKSKSKGPAPPAAAPSPSPIAVKKIVKEEVKPQRTRQEDPDKAKKEKQARERAEQARERAEQLAENTRNAALAREQAIQVEQKEKQARQAAQKQEQDRQAAEKKITVVKNGDKYIIKETQAYTDYKEKLNKIPPTTCKPTK